MGEAMLVHSAPGGNVSRLEYENMRTVAMRSCRNLPTTTANQTRKTRLDKDRVDGNKATRRIHSSYMNDQLYEGRK